ncbi:hypothetical protein E7735_21090 [Enterobacter cloacae]|nr:hypothetical protein E7735_21090 [Enterobacter cloacae]QCC98297.1 hypothetical protein E7739_20785 [Enterobacter cloacae]QCD09774.1 hypothetical protein E7729_03825 [Enterobacter cloacae]
MWLMKTLLTSGCTNQRGAGQSVIDGTDNASIKSVLPPSRWCIRIKRALWCCAGRGRHCGSNGASKEIEGIYC